MENVSAGHLSVVWISRVNGLVDGFFHHSVNSCNSLDERVEDVQPREEKAPGDLSVASQYLELAFREDGEELIRGRNYR